MANAITITGSAITTAVATDPDLCRVSGYLINAHGTPLAGTTFVLRYCYDPMATATDTLVLQERLRITADSAGYVEFDLIRKSYVTVEFPNLMTSIDTVKLKVPDASSIDIVGLLFPYVVSVDWTDGAAVSVSVTGAFTVQVTATFSNGDTAIMPSSGITIVSSNEAIVKKKEGYVYEGIGAGSATLTVTAVDVSKLSINQDREEAALVFFNLPTVTLPGSSISVTVS